MANFTPNYNLKKPLGSENYNVADQNGNMDTIDTALNGIDAGLAIVSTGNTHAAITAGQYVYVRRHGSLAEGLYKANSNIAANATLTSSNLSSVSGGLGGEVSSLNSKIATYDFGSKTLSEFNAALDTYCANMIAGDYRHIIVNITSDSSPFIAGKYTGTVECSTNEIRFSVILSLQASPITIRGYRTGTAWRWANFTLDRDITPVDYSSSLSVIRPARSGLYKVGRMVFISISETAGANIDVSASSWTNIASVPSDCYPLTQVDMEVVRADGKVCVGRITTTGSIDILSKNAITIEGSYGFRVNVSYVSAS